MQILLRILFLALFVSILSYLFFYRKIEDRNTDSILFERIISNSSDERFLDKRLKPKKLLYSPSESFCDGLDFVVGIHTHFSDSKMRRILRRTYGSLQQKYNFKIFFPVGIGWNNPPLAKESLEFEHYFYKDILQHEYVDTYRNLTYKHIALLRFFADHCSSKTILLKLDSDVVWKVNSLSNYIRKFKNDESSSLSCYEVTERPVLRVGKWRVSKEEYPAEIYPKYCAGFAYLMTQRMAMALLTKLPKMTLFWIDDVFVLGMVRKATGIKFKRMNRKFSAHIASVKWNLCGMSTILSLTRKQEMEKYFTMFNLKILETCGRIFGYFAAM